MTVDYAERLDALLTGTLRASDFRHVDHIGVAYEALRRDDYVRATTGVAAGIRALAARAGKPQKFNATTTMAFMSLIAERMRTTEHYSAADFIARNPDLSDRTVLERWYSPGRLNSPLAREVALLPDLSPTLAA